ncbi:hypothetical protein AG1IA_05558 [Rhizoctonia solani AG-1 IA]|uniref:Uncharacterized protein n=1 Tax=Thanatephorus cucumeris (strain AG1-IA) TaxID=983506 RepID=L8WUH1_THACA|nr:hypothetical protein AG1IA_05558 [Rhizoctonia solani AG-1 IA]
MHTALGRPKSIYIVHLTRTHKAEHVMSTPPGQRRPYLGGPHLYHLTSSPAFAAGRNRNASPPARPSSATAASGHNRTSSGSGALLLSSRKPTTPALDAGLLDNSPTLIRATATVVKTRGGTVLSRGCILKTDHYPTGMFGFTSLKADIAHITIPSRARIGFGHQSTRYNIATTCSTYLTSTIGAPNFRAPRGAAAALNVYGAAQPRVGGLRAILSILGCNPPKSSSGSPGISPLARASRLPNKVGCVWFSTREEPVIYIAGRPYVLREASDPKTALQLSDRASNIEAIEDRDNESLIPTWTSVDVNSVKTPREVWEEAKEEGWNVERFDQVPLTILSQPSIPITPDRAIEDNYLDAYLNVIKSVDPLETALVFHCGMGAVRTRGHPSGGSPSASRDPARTEQIVATLDLFASTNATTHSAIELLLAQPTLMDNLRKAHMGNYGLVLSLLGCLEDGLHVKKLADRVIDSCDHVANLREEILAHRVDYSVTSMDDKGRSAHILKAKRAMEK